MMIHITYYILGHSYHRKFYKDSNAAKELIYELNLNHIRFTKTYH